MQGIQRISGVVTLTGQQYVYDLTAQDRHQITAVLTKDDLKGYEEERRQMIQTFTDHFYPNRKKIHCLPNSALKKIGDKYLLDFRWKEEVRMPIWDSAGNRLTEPAAINAGAEVKLAFQQVAFGDRLFAGGRERAAQSPRHGTALKLRGIQLIKESTTSCDHWSEENIGCMFGVHPNGYLAKPHR